MAYQLGFFPHRGERDCIMVSGVDDGVFSQLAGCST